MFNSASAFDPSEGSSEGFPIPFVQESASQQFHTPETYIRSEEERPNEFSSHRMDFPIIDIGMFLGDSESCRQKELEKLDNACRQWGFFQVISNGVYKSIEHRAVTNRYRDRISIAMFYGPSGECEVGPAPELIDELHPCQYRTFIHKDYMEFYFIRKLDKNASIEFAKIN